MNHARHGANEKAKSSSRLAGFACELASPALPKAHANAAERDYF